MCCFKILKLKTNKFSLIAYLKPARHPLYHHKIFIKQLTAGKTNYYCKFLACPFRQDSKLTVPLHP